MASGWYEERVERKTEEMQHEAMIVNGWLTCSTSKYVLNVYLNMSMSGDIAASLSIELHAVDGYNEE